MTPRLVTLLTAAVLMSSLTACGGTEDSTPPRPAPSATDPARTASTPPSPEDRIAMAAVEVVQVESSGGECADGACPVTTTVVHGDGSWVVTEGDTVRTGVLAADDLNRLIRLTYEDDVAAHPKDAQSCESWVDGRDVALTYAPPTDGETLTVSSCDYDLSGSRLLEFVAEATA